MQSEKFAPSSLYTKISMLKSSLLAKKNIDIKKYHKVDSYLRQNAVGYIPKKSKTLSKEEVLNFLNNASDEDYLMEKVALAFGILGACRKGEIVNIKLRDIEDKGSVLVINIPVTKNYKARSFCVLDNQELNAMGLYRKYLALRPENVGHDRFFLSCKKGRCTRQPVGKNTIGGICKKIALFLGLENPSLYTGHCFRRSAATQLADSGGDITMLKRLGGWKSTSVTEGYIDDSMCSKNKISRLLAGVSSSVSSNDSVGNVETTMTVEASQIKISCSDVSGVETKLSEGCNVSFHNCTIENVHLHK